MTKPPSSLVLQLELENLKEHMSSVQAEMGRFVTSLMVQSQDVCEVLARIEIVTAMVRAGQTIVREKLAEEEVSFPNSKFQNWLTIMTRLLLKILVNCIILLLNSLILSTEMKDVMKHAKQKSQISQ